jgi:hypothetical protein
LANELTRMHHNFNQVQTCYNNYGRMYNELARLNRMLAEDKTKLLAQLAGKLDPK